MRFPRRGQLLLAVLVLGLTLPSAAASQTATPSAASPPVTLVPGPDPAAPRAKPHGPVFIRLSGGFEMGLRYPDSIFAVTGFMVVAGVAFRIAHREDMEIQVDVSYLDYSGSSGLHPGGSQSLDGRAIGPTALYFYNFLRGGRDVMPFLGGGVSVAHLDETVIRRVSNPFFGPGTFESRMTGWTFSLQGAGGVQFASHSRVPFRLEGRLGLGVQGPLFLVLGGISF